MKTHTHVISISNEGEEEGEKERCYNTVLQTVHRVVWLFGHIFTNRCRFTGINVIFKNVSNRQRIFLQIGFAFQRYNMFFVVYAIGAREHIIIPIHWVNNYKVVIEKSVKYSINTNQKHLCFHTPIKDMNVEAKIQPNFHLPVQFTTINRECCFHGMIVSFFRK